MVLKTLVDNGTPKNTHRKIGESENGHRQLITVPSYKTLQNPCLLWDFHVSPSPAVPAALDPELCPAMPAMVEPQGGLPWETYDSYRKKTGHI